jgi:hypothetical protein
MSMAFPPLNPEYDEFLYAIVSNEKNGMQLTMASAIARSGVDPWKEAARISKLPKDAALGALAGLVPNLLTEHNAIAGQITADRLYSLLPKHGPRLTIKPHLTVNKPDAIHIKPVVVVLIIGLCLVAILASVLTKTPRPDAESQLNVPASSIPAEALQ